MASGGEEHELQDFYDCNPDDSSRPESPALNAPAAVGGAPCFPGSPYTPTNPFHPDYDADQVAREGLESSGIDPNNYTIRDLLQMGWVRVKRGQRAIATHSGSLAVGAALGAAVASAAWSSHCTSESSSVISDALSAGHAVYQAAKGDYAGASSSILRIGPQGQAGASGHTTESSTAASPVPAADFSWEQEDYPDLYPDG